MSDRHVTASELESYVIGACAEDDVARIEAHVVACKACEARLQSEAAIDLAFTQVATRAIEHEKDKPRRVARVVAPAFAAGAALAIAAAILLWVAPRGDGDAHAASAVDDTAAPVITETNADASTFTASLDVQVDGSRLGLRD